MIRRLKVSLHKANDDWPGRVEYDRRLAILVANTPPEHLERGIRYLLTALEIKIRRLPRSLKK